MDAIILSSPPAASPFAAAGRAPRSRGCIAVLVVALVGSVAGLFATLRWSYGRAPVPQTAFLVATLPPGSDIPDEAPAIWREARHALTPSIFGFFIGAEGTPKPFALRLQAPWGTPGNRTGWRVEGIEPSSLPGTDLGPSFSLSRWRSAWLKVDFGGERLEGPFMDGAWTVDVPLGADAFAFSGEAFQYTTLLALPGATDAFKELGIDAPPGTGRASWSIDGNGTLSALKIEASDELPTSTIASVLSAIPGSEASSTRATIATTSRSIAWNGPKDVPAIPETCPGNLVARLPASALDGWLPWRPHGTTLSIASRQTQTSFCWK